MAMIMPGPIQDADFNAVGYLALQQVAKTYDLQVSHSESVVVADAERITREYVTAGYEIVANHGGQFIPIMNKLAPQLSNATWIQEASGRLPTCRSTPGTSAASSSRASTCWARSARSRRRATRWGWCAACACPT